MMLPPIFGFVRYFSWIVGDFCGFSCASVTLLRRSREVRMALPTRCEDSTAAVEVRRSDCRWAFVFSDAGDPQMCDRHARSRATRSRWGQRKAKTGTISLSFFGPRRSNRLAQASGLQTKVVLQGWSRKAINGVELSSARRGRDVFLDWAACYPTAGAAVSQRISARERNSATARR
jgi:hypothetical protein